MSDPQLPQPIYPPGGGGPGGGGPGGPGGGGPGGGWGAPTGPPPAGPGGYPPSGPPAGPPSGGSWGPPGPGFTPAPGPAKDSGLSRNQIIAIIAAIAIIGGLIAGAIASQDDDGGDTKTTAQTSEGGGGNGTGGGGTGGGAGGSASAVAQEQFQGAATSTIDCIANGLEADGAVLAELTGDADGAVIDDPANAARYGELVANCSNTQELSGLLGMTLTQSGMDGALAQCIAANTQGFGSAQWAEFLAASVQTAEAAYLEGVITDLASTC